MKKRILLFLGIWVLCAVAAVTHLPERQGPGFRTSTDAYIPFRPATADELVLILNTQYQGRPYGHVTRLTADNVTVVTSNYVAADIDGTLRPTSASWNGYSIVHEIARDDLEKALGRHLTDSDVRQGKIGPVSFYSRYWWLYAVAETIFLAAFIYAAGVFLTAGGSFWLLPGKVFLLILGYLVAIHFAAPTVMDADYFYQRLIIEVPVPFLMLAGIYLAPFGVLSLLCYIAVRTLRAVAGAALVAGAVAALLAAVYMSKTAAIESTLAKSAECISVDRLIKVARETAPSGENFRNFFESGQNSAELKKVIDEINQCASGVSANYLQAVRIQLKLDSSRGMYIVPSTLSPYADLREPPVLAAGQTSFVGWLHGLMRNWQSSLHASRPLATKDREVVGVVTYY